jgi:hypothetical protein
MAAFINETHKTYGCAHTDDYRFILYMKTISFACGSEDLCKYTAYTVVWLSVFAPINNTLHNLFILYVNEETQ